MKNAAARLASTAIASLTLASGLLVGQPAHAATPPCTVTSAKMISRGGDQDWSHTNGLIALDQTDANGIYQLHTIKPDGTGDTCLTCSAAAGAPPTDRHKFNPVWTPNGQFIVVQGEIPYNPLDWARNNKYVTEWFLNGLWTDLYATTPTGDKWYRLTNMSITGVDGILAPSFSPDGSKLFASRMIEPASATHPWGVYRLMIADFVVQNGIPSLKNVRDVTPPGGSFYEAHGFSLDGQKLIFASDIGAGGTFDMNIFTLDLVTGALTELTKNGSWNEHAHYAVNGKIVYMSGQPYPLTWLTTDLMMMNSDGSAKTQITHFNTPGYAEYSTDQSTPGRASWSSDGTQLAVTSGPTKDFPSRQLYMLTYAGACGR